MFKRTHLGLGLAALVLASVLLLSLGLQSARAAGPYCDGSGCFYIQTTTNDFVRGEFYATGLRNLGDGEVQLLPIGLSSPWTTAADLPETRAELALVSYNNILYAIGGYGGTPLQYQTEIYSATTSVVGGITGNWQLADNLPTARAGAAAVIALVPDPVLYVIGGGTGSGSNTIYYKKIGAGGNLSGSWDSATLPENLAYSSAVARGNNLYIFGGTPNATDSVYRVPIINTDGDLGSPVNDMFLPKKLTMSTAVTWEGETTGHVYVLGGLDDGPASSEDVYSTHFNGDGTLNNGGPVSGWNSTSLVDAFNAHGTVQVNGAVFVVGGRQGIGSSDTVTKVQTALIDPDGSLHDWGGGIGHWIITEPLPKPRFLHGTAVNDGGEIFMAGGYNNQFNPTNTVYHGSTTGVGSTYAPLGTFTSEPFDAGVGGKLKGIQWNASVQDTSQMGLTIYYRTANSLVNLQNEAWTLAGTSAQSANGFTNTLTFPAIIERRYLQYKAEFETNISDQSPRLNAFRLDLHQMVTPTHTNTPSSTPGTPTATATPTQTETPGASVTPTPTITATTCAAKPPKPLLANPAHKSKLKKRNVKLKWNESPCATKYKVIVRTGSAKGKKVFTKGNITDLKVKVKNLKPGKKYFWMVKAQNSMGTTKSVWFRFKIKR